MIGIIAGIIIMLVTPVILAGILYLSRPTKPYICQGVDCPMILIPIIEHPWRAEVNNTDLLESMRAIGQRNPIILWIDDDDKYHLIDGFRRVAVARQLDWKHIKVIIDTTPDDQMFLRVAKNISGKLEFTD